MHARIVYAILVAAVVLLAVVLNMDRETRMGREPESPPIPAETRDGRWVQDVDYLWSQLPRLHIDLFGTLKQSEFDHDISVLRDAVPDLSDQEIKLGIARIVAKVGDGHTTPFRNWTSGFQRLALALRWYSDGLFIVRTGTGLEGFVGSKILRIGNTETADALEKVSEIISFDNETNLRQRSIWYLRNVTVLNLLGIVERPDSARYTIVTREGDTTSVVFSGTSGKIDWTPIQTEKLPLYLRNGDAPFWYEQLVESRTLFFKYNQCTAVDKFRGVAAELKERIGSGAFDRLVIDFRGNGGGNSAIFSRHLLSFLREDAYINRKGRLFSVIDGGSFSSAVLNAISLKHGTNAITIGSSTGGKPNHFGNTRYFSLPNSGLNIQYSTMRFELLPELGDVPSFEPDVPIPMRSTDYFSGKDPVFDWILAYDD
jgi:hypothetical protein